MQTSGPLVPSEVRSQAALHSATPPDFFSGRTCVGVLITAPRRADKESTDFKGPFSSRGRVLLAGPFSFRKGVANQA